jgi:diguanylate cyclase (GGDEF)-like protein
MSALVLIQFGLSLLAAFLGGAAGWWLRGRPRGHAKQATVPSQKQVAAEVLQSLQAAADTVRSCVEQHTECIRTIQSELNESTSTEPAIITKAAESIVSSNGLVQHQIDDIQNTLSDQQREIRDCLASTDGLLFTFASLDRQKHIYRQVLSSLEVLASELTRDVQGHGQRLQKITGELESGSGASTSQVASAITQILDAAEDVERRVAATERRITSQAAAVQMQAILSHSDLLTSLPNRRALEAELDRLCQTTGRPSVCTLLFADLDDFAHVNAGYGHQGGDLVLRQAAGLLKNLVRGRDMVVRFGGDRFAMLLTQTTLHDSLPLAERARSLIAETEFSHGSHPLRVTVSVGIAQLMPDEVRGALVARAEEALDAAQRTGGNACYRHDGKQCHPVSSVFHSKQCQEKEQTLSLASLWRDSTVPGDMANPIESTDESDALQGSLTGRSLFAANLGRRLAEWKRGGASVSVAVLSVDQMGALVEQFGDQGHAFLRQVLGRLLETTTRDMDERCEFEDGLFALLLPGTDKGNALAVAERLCSQIRQCKVRMGSDLWDLTASIGVAHCTVAARVMDIMLSAEAAMNLAANSGGDAVRVGEPFQEPIKVGTH